MVASLEVVRLVEQLVEQLAGDLQVAKVASMTLLHMDLNAVIQHGMNMA